MFYENYLQLTTIACNILDQASAMYARCKNTMIHWHMQKDDFQYKMDNKFKFLTYNAHNNNTRCFEGPTVDKDTLIFSPEMNKELWNQLSKNAKHKIFNYIFNKAKILNNPIQSSKLDIRPRIAHMNEILVDQGKSNLKNKQQSATIDENKKQILASTHCKARWLPQGSIHQLLPNLSSKKESPQSKKASISSYKRLTYKILKLNSRKTRKALTNRGTMEGVAGLDTAQSIKQIR